MEVIKVINFLEIIPGFTETIELCKIFNLISIIKLEQNEYIKANRILVTPANFIVSFNVALFLLMTLVYIGTVKLLI